VTVTEDLVIRHYTLFVATWQTAFVVVNITAGFDALGGICYNR
jgi:hypothetical protein